MHTLSLAKIPLIFFSILSKVHQVQHTVMPTLAPKEQNFKSLEKCKSKNWFSKLVTFWASSKAYNQFDH